MMKPTRALLAAAILAAAAPSPAAVPTSPASNSNHQRLIVLTDIEADPDDTESLVRLMLYSNQVDIEGLVATTSVHMKSGLHADSIRRVVEAYGRVRGNLLLHEPGFPTSDALLGMIRDGQPIYGMAAVGAGKDTPGSDRIVTMLKAPDSRPLWVTIWGGANTLAQALYRIRESETPAEADRLLAKLRVYTISDQDDSGAWIRKTFPSLFYIVSPGGYGGATWTAINTVIDGIDNRTIGNDWLRANIQQGHGPLGAAYPDVSYGMEGDTPSWLSLIPNGLGDPEHPEWGGWGGRYELYVPSLANMDVEGFTGGVPIEAETRPIWTNAIDTYSPSVSGDYGRAHVPAQHSFKDFRTTLWRWRDDFQNDFAARMAWSTLPYAKANHPPVPRLATSDHLTVHSGEVFVLSALGSSDPDGDSLSYLWFQYTEAGSLRAQVPALIAENIYRVSYRAPVVTKPETVHFILKVTDKGNPPLSRYRRVIVTILP